MGQRTEFEILRDLNQALDKLPDGKDPNELIEKAKEEEMVAKRKIKDRADRTQVGSWIDKELWKQIKSQAALEGRGAGYVLDDAIKVYIKGKAQQQQNNRER